MPSECPNCGHDIEMHNHQGCVCFMVNMITGVERDCRCPLSPGECRELQLAIRRHVDNIKQVYIDCDQNFVCEYCGYEWGEKSDTYNGGCCDKDEENNPWILNEKQTV